MWNSSEPVRYTDWFIPPTPSPSGCYVFHSNPFHRDDPMSINGLGSLRPESTCDAMHYVVCQTAAVTASANFKPSVVKTADSSNQHNISHHQPHRPSCFRMDETKFSSVMYRADLVRSVSNKSCIRSVSNYVARTFENLFCCNTVAARI